MYIYTSSVCEKVFLKGYFFEKFLEYWHAEYMILERRKLSSIRQLVLYVLCQRQSIAFCHTYAGVFSSPITTDNIVSLFQIK